MQKFAGLGVLFSVFILSGVSGCSSAPSHGEGEESDAMAALPAIADSMAGGTCVGPAVNLGQSGSRSTASVTQIEARSFPMNLIRPASGPRKVHTFSYDSDKAPGERKLLLIRNQSEPVAAIRVIRTNPAQHKFYGVVICQYEKAGGLQPKASYTGVEKLRDL